MAILSLRDIHQSFGLLRKRVSALPKRSSREKWLPPWAKLRAGLISGGFFLVSIVFAWSAQDLVRSAALKEWELRRIPSSITWKYALTSLGFHAPSTAENLHRASRALPSMQDNPGSIWADATYNWVGIFQPSSEESLQIYCRHCEQPPQSWSPSGLGWSGFDHVLSRIAQIKEPPSAPRQAPRKNAARDPRALEY